MLLSKSNFLLFIIITTVMSMMIFAYIGPMYATSCEANTIIPCESAKAEWDLIHKLNFYDSMYRILTFQDVYRPGFKSSELNATWVFSIIIGVSTTISFYTFIIVDRLI